MKLNSSGQSVDDAIRQLKKRDSKNRLFKFNAGVLASFAVDTLEVYMTTEIKGQDTYFLPFNMGKGEGVDQGLEIRTMNLVQIQLILAGSAD